MTQPSKEHGYLTVKKKGDQVGVFAAKNLASGEGIAVFENNFSVSPSKYTIQVDWGRHLRTDGHVGAMLNHSCCPNAQFQVEAHSLSKTMKIIALKSIEEGEEVTFNYLASEWDMAEPFVCNCGAPHCFGFIKGYRYLTPSDQERVAAIALPYVQEAQRKNVQPPLWPEDSLARCSGGQPTQDFTKWAGTIVAYAQKQRISGGPLRGDQRRWMTSGHRVSRAEAEKSYESARRELAIGEVDGARDETSGVKSGAVGVEQAVLELLKCHKDSGTNDSHGGYMAYAPTGALFESALASLTTSLLNPGLTWMPTSPQFAAMEQTVLDWVAHDVLHWPAGSGGLFTSGGSLANTLGLHVARESMAQRAGVSPREVLFFVSDLAHYSIPKALRVLGVGPDQIINVPRMREGSLDISGFERVLASNAQRLVGGAGVVVGIGGETSTGYVDRLDLLADLCAAYGDLWLHVDACFGGFFTLTQRGDDLLRGMERAASVALDPHKALQTPYGVGLLMVRHEEDLRQTFTADAAYVPPGQGKSKDRVVYDIADLGLELTREARGAQVWLPLRAHGPKAFGSHLDWCQDAVRWIAQTLMESCDLLEITSPPQLSMMTFSLRRKYESISRQELTDWLVDEVNGRGQVFLAPTKTYAGQPCVRICVLSIRTGPEHLRHLVEDIVASARTLAELVARLDQARTNPKRSLGFRVPYGVRPLPGRGLGIIAECDIPEGALVWEFEPGSCLETSVQEVRQMVLEKGRAKGASFLNHCFCWGDQILYPQGDTQFFNHSSHPNIVSLDGRSWIASRPISRGEEILDNYGTYQENEIYEELCREFGAESSSRVAALYES